jgi:hypothetical protein
MRPWPNWGIGLDSLWLVAAAFAFLRLFAGLSSSLSVLLLSIVSKCLGAGRLLEYCLLLLCAVLAVGGGGARLILLDSVNFRCSVNFGECMDVR